MYTVYCHIFPNGKKYVGITKSSPEKRWGNGNKYKTCRLVDRAIQKYGWENVEHKLLDTADTIEEAEEKERLYISLFKSNSAEYGYNILPGGDVSTNELTPEMRESLGNGWRGKHRTEEEKRKISAGVKRKFDRPESNGHLGKKASDETREKMSAAHKASWAENKERREGASKRMSDRMADPEYKKRIVDNLHSIKRSGYKLSDEQKKKISEYQKGRWIGEKSPNSKPVVQYTKDGVFVKRWANAGEAARAGVAQRRNIGKCCNRTPHVHTVGGFVWRFEGDPF